MRSNFSEVELRQRRATISPYREVLVANRDSLLAALERLKWDLRPISWESKRRLKTVRDSQLGRKAVILCNGPSLLRSNLSHLDGLYTFGLNKINLLFDKRSFRPSCIVAVNRLVLEQNAQFFNSTSSQLYLSHKGLSFVRPRSNVTFMHTLHSNRFARDITSSINDGATVTFVALQLAFHMGFRRVALIGCDHNFAIQGPSNMTVQSQGPDLSHFDPNYFGHGVHWQLPDLEVSEMSYKLARNVYAAFGGEVVNATEGGKLEVFRRQSLSDFIAE